MNEQHMSLARTGTSTFQIMRRAACVAAAAALTSVMLGGALLANAAEDVATAQALAITFKSAPMKAGAKDAPAMGATPVLAMGNNALEVTVKDGMGMAMADADVSVVFSMAAMPAMSMPAMRNVVALKAAGGGVYRATTQVTMGGKWGVAVLVKQTGKDVGKRELSVVAK